MFILAPCRLALASCCNFGYKTNTNDIIRTNNRMAAAVVATATATAAAVAARLSSLASS